jgi:PAS domain S-box-containing protein
MAAIDNIDASNGVRAHTSSLQMAPPVDWSGLRKSEHFVQFYEQDSFLTSSVASFMGAGMVNGEAAIIIATANHRLAICENLQEQGISIEKAEAVGQLFLLDASETLARFMVQGKPDPALFNKVIGGLVARSTSEDRPLRAFGEMVALLWQKGNADAAIRLEELWNDLGKKYTFSLFCAYPMSGFCSEAHGQPFTHICKAHTRVIPAESYTATTTADERLRTITMLQQKVATLETVQKVLARRERELSDFLENATEGIHQVAPDGTILWANDAELNLLGYSRDEFIGHDIREFHADADVIANILERLMRGEKLHDCEARLKHKDGSLRYVSINSSMYREGDTLQYTRCFTRDVTERKRASEILEQTVVERTAELTETIAELEAFSYSVSHDLRSPLRAMEGCARALLKDYASLLPEDGIDALHRIERAAARLDLLVRDILAYSKVSKGEIQLTIVDLDSLLEDLLQQHPQFHAARHHITIDHPLPRVRGHQACLGQCFANLVDNALKFIAPGATPKLHIRGEHLGEQVRICVADNGIGIAAEHRDRIFQIFGRVYPEKRYPGTGIGLAIVKKAVVRMGGTIGFESESGKGSTFWFTLPLAANGD